MNVELSFLKLKQVSFSSHQFDHFSFIFFWAEFKSHRNIKDFWLIFQYHTDYLNV